MVKHLQIIAIGLAFVLAGFLSACEFNGSNTDSNSLPSSSGKYGEVLVVLDTAIENGPVGEKVKEIFQSEVPGTPQMEPLFRMSTVDPDYFKSILKRSRNLFRISIKKQHENRIKVDRNVWAKDQLLINLYANSEEDALRILEKNQNQIRDYYNEEELDRLTEQFLKGPDRDLMEEIEVDYGVSLLIPPAFVKMASDSNSFWLKKEKSIGEHQVVQGLIFYSFPYESEKVFSDSAMIEHRDQISRKFIEGGRENSYMQVYAELKPVSEEINLNGDYAKEYRGLWHMKNDFMGGPYLHYTLIDQGQNRVINIDGFVYAPKFNKREYIRELEAIIKSLELKSE